MIKIKKVIIIIQMKTLRTIIIKYHESQVIYLDMNVKKKFFILFVVLFVNDFLNCLCYVKFELFPKLKLKIFYRLSLKYEFRYFD